METASWQALVLALVPGAGVYNPLWMVFLCLKYCCRNFLRQYYGVILWFAYIVSCLFRAHLPSLPDIQCLEKSFIYFASFLVFVFSFVLFGLCFVLSKIVTLTLLLQVELKQKFLLSKFYIPQE